MPTEKISNKHAECISEWVLTTSIRETSVLVESSGFGKTIFEHNQDNNSQYDYESLAISLMGKRFI
jgi:hypothetical protein